MTPVAHISLIGELIFWTVALVVGIRVLLFFSDMAKGIRRSPIWQNASAKAARRRRLIEKQRERSISSRIGTGSWQ